MGSAGRTRWYALPIVILGMSTSILAATQPDPFPTWAFPGANMEMPKQGWDNRTPLHLPGAKTTFTQVAVHDGYAPPDWFPDSHPASPDVVLHGRRGELAACGYCHLPDGSGRPENASLSGLPADYIRRQVAAFRAGMRKPASPDWVPTVLMTHVAAIATEQEVTAAADYFSAIPARRHFTVVETERITASEAKAFLLRAIPGGGELLGQRIVEGPADFERFEQRDPRLVYTAFVPIGSLKRGAVLARSGGNGLTVPCATCHGIGLRGGAAAVGPPIAGRSPSYIFRQLYAFSTGARGGEASQPMLGVVAGLTQKDMIALAAYAGSLKP